MIDLGLVTTPQLHWAVHARNPKPENRDPEPETRDPRPEMRNPRPGARNLKPDTLDPEPEASDRYGSLERSHFFSKIRKALLRS